jgi:hypothetical protein
MGLVASYIETVHVAVYKAATMFKGVVTYAETLKHDHHTTQLSHRSSSYALDTQKTRVQVCLCNVHYIFLFSNH